MEAPPFFPNAGRGQIKDFIQLIQQSASGGTKQGSTVFLWDGLDEEGREECEREILSKHEKIGWCGAERDQ